jgi:hypothetical protein
MSNFSSKNVRFDEDDINRQKQCIPGPNVQFGKNALPFSEYLRNLETPGSLGCNPNQYPKYTDGKYCCDTTMATPQEQLDYVNTLLKASIENVGESAYRKNEMTIDTLIRWRNILLQNNTGENTLDDTLEVPEDYKDIEEYYRKNLVNSRILDYDREDRKKSNDQTTENNTDWNRINNKKFGGRKSYKYKKMYTKMRNIRAKSVKKNRLSKKKRHHKKSRKYFNKSKK